MIAPESQMTRDDPDPLAKVLGHVRTCRNCQVDFGFEPRPVIRANSQARLCIAGQAPGTRVHASGVPFDDPSGNRLRDWMGIGHEVFYDEKRLAIVPMGFCFPGLDARGGDLPPAKICARLWRAQVFEHLPNVELTLLMGQYAQGWHLGKRRKASLTETVRVWQEYLPEFLPLPHPSWRNNTWLKKNPWFEEDVLPVLRRRVGELISA